MSDEHEHEDEDVLLETHPSLRNFLRHFIGPAIGVPALIVVLRMTVWPTLPFYPWMLLVILVGSVFPLMAWLETRFHTYVVREESVMARKGLVSRFTQEIRIADIRVVSVRQSVLKRILGIGDVGFASAAADYEEVVFANVRNPEVVKRLVQDRMKRHEKGKD